MTVVHQRYRRWLLLVVAATAMTILLWPRAGALPQELVLTFSDGGRTTIGNLQGRLLVLDFWSLSCTQCLQDMPKWADLLPALRQHGAELISVSIPQDPPSLAIAKARQLALPWPFALDPRGEISAAVGGIEVTPTLILIDRKGTIVDRRYGALDSAWLLERLSGL